MKLVDGNIVLDNRTCYSCDTNGTQPTAKVCSKCDGSGRGPRGGRGGCKNCYNGRVWDHENRVACDHCGGSNSVAETWFDSVGDVVEHALRQLPVMVVRADRNNNWVENYIGGGVYSCLDYGRMAARSDEDIEANFGAEASFNHTQGVKVIADYRDRAHTAPMPDRIVINLRRDGYTVYIERV